MILNIYIHARLAAAHRRELLEAVAHHRPAERDCAPRTATS
jgi:hypothetical protein